MDGCSPSRMIDGNVQKQVPIIKMDTVGQLHELFKGRGRRIKLGQGRINFCKIQGCIRTAKPPHPGIGCGSRMNGQQMENTAAKTGKNKRNLFFQIPELAGLRNDRVPACIQLLDEDRHVLLFRPAGFGSAELTDKCIVNNIGTTGAGRLHIEDTIVTPGPGRRGVAGRHKKTFCLEKPGLVKGQDKGIHPICLPHHLNINPGFFQFYFILFHPVNDFFACNGRRPQVGSHPGLTVCLERKRQGKGHTIPAIHDP